MNPREGDRSHGGKKEGLGEESRRGGRRRRWEQSLVFSRCIPSLVIHDGLSTPTPGHTRPITSTGSNLLASGPITLLTYYMSTDTLVLGVSGVTGRLAKAADCGRSRRDPIRLPDVYGRGKEGKT